MVLFTQGTWGAGQLELRQQRALLALELLVSLHLGRKSDL